MTRANEDNLEEASRNDATDVPYLAPPQLLLIPRTSCTTNTSKYFRSRISVSTCISITRNHPWRKSNIFFYNWNISKIFLPFRYFIDHSFAKNFFEISERFSFEEQQGWPRYWLYRGQDFDIRLLSRMIFVLTRVTTETQVAVNGVVFYFGQSAGYIAAESVDQGSQLDNGSFEIWLWVTRLFFSSFFSLANPVLSPCFNFYPYLIFFFFFCSLEDNFLPRFRS